MKYIRDSVGSALLPKILGTYELELHEVIERLIAARPATVLNIGAAEGYYAVGLARRLPETTISCWETSQMGRQLLAQLLREISIPEERVSIQGLCSLSELRDALVSVDATETCLLLVDIERSEVLLLDPAILPELFSCHILVEIHEFAVTGAEKLLAKRFCQTQEIERFEAKPRVFADWPETALNLSRPGSKGTAIAVTCEERPPGMSWMYLKPLSK